MELNKIYLKDAYQAIKEIPDKSIDLIITDPPYELGCSYGSGVTKDRPYLKDIENNNLQRGIDLTILDEFVRISKSINIYIWCNKLQILEYLKYFVDKKKCSFEIIVWRKENPIPVCNTHYLVDKEYCLFFRDKNAPIHVSYEKGATVYSTQTNTKEKEEYKHPTIKPLFIIENFIENSSVRGGVVFDAFIGSGTTAIAAKNLGRNFIGFEINPEFYKIACDRLNGINQKGELNLFETDFENLQLNFEENQK